MVDTPATNTASRKASLATLSQLRQRHATSTANFEQHRTIFSETQTALECTTKTLAADKAAISGAQADVASARAIVRTCLAPAPVAQNHLFLYTALIDIMAAPSLSFRRHPAIIIVAATTPGMKILGPPTEDDSLSVAGARTTAQDGC